MMMKSDPDRCSLSCLGCDLTTFEIGFMGHSRRFLQRGSDLLDKHTVPWPATIFLKTVQ